MTTTAKNLPEITSEDRIKKIRLSVFRKMLSILQAYNVEIPSGTIRMRYIEHITSVVINDDDFVGVGFEERCLENDLPETFASIKEAFVMAYQTTPDASRIQIHGRDRDFFGPAFVELQKQAPVVEHKPVPKPVIRRKPQAVISPIAQALIDSGHSEMGRRQQQANRNRLMAVAKASGRAS